ncbi:Translocation protein sec72 [Neolecta irregularis DAH-3]|uniref:Translocation protein sec72 n=1 Tax=Neolecta irregularis (strain DAH-3) TaxID=1198029 RepID=A0A1U7LSY3_NEOID|nr:Translocation protein sec72 [Neolecta irregularis DAH-3]|eukprot:OLL25780.1 Translocation protein sec72 [Neolecta irregularis DAH-3]
MDYFTTIPLQIAETKKTVSLTTQAPQITGNYAEEVARLNSLYKFLANYQNDQGEDTPLPQDKKTVQAMKNRSEQVTKLKDTGNVAFRKNNFQEALKYYTLAIEMSANRPPWENSVQTRDELAIVLCNRSACYMSLQKWPEAYADAEGVIEFKRPWSKGHLRRGKALQMLGKLKEAKEAIQLGLEFEPNDEDLKSALIQLKEFEENKGSE